MGVSTEYFKMQYVAMRLLGADNELSYTKHGCAYGESHKEALCLLNVTVRQDPI